jgi:H+/Cl- antiporter ClcA
MGADYSQAEVLEALARGIMIGGSVGVLGGLFFLDFPRALALGLISGFFAALTRLRLKKRKKPGD